LKILYINELLNSSGGCSIHGRKITEKLKSFNISLLTIPHINEEKTIKFRRNLIKILMLNMPSILREFLSFIMRNLKYFIRLIAISYTIKNYKPDCILIRTEDYDLTPIVLKKIIKIPIVLEVNAAFYLERKLDYELRNKKPIIPSLLSNLDLRIWKCADGIYVISNCLKKIIKSQLGDKSPFISVIPNGADINYFNNLAAKKLKENSDLIKIGFVGSFNYRHGVDLLVDVYEEIARLRPMTKLILIGDGVLRENLEEYVSLNKNLIGKVEFIGRLTHDETMERLSNMDILVAPYKFTKFFYFSPLKVIEYMAAGKAIVASKLGQINEILENGVDAILINPENNKEFCNALLALIDSEEQRTKLGNMAYHKAKQYTWEKSAFDLLNLFQKVVTERCTEDNLT